jgi:hypothetical protein
MQIFGSPDDVIAVAFFGTVKNVRVRDFENLSVGLRKVSSNINIEI